MPSVAVTITSADVLAVTVIPSTVTASESVVMVTSPTNPAAVTIAIAEPPGIIITSPSGPISVGSGLLTIRGAPAATAFLPLLVNVLNEATPMENIVVPS